MNLFVYLSNRCNLTCDYCPVLLNAGRALFLDAEDLRRAVDLYTERTPGANGNIILQGGEPFLRGDLLRAAVADARSRTSRPGVHVFTNGLLLKRAILDELEGRGAAVTLSIDGDEATTDASRHLHGREGSVAARILEVLEAERIRPSRLNANMVVTPSNVDRLAANVAWLHRLGFAAVSFQPDAWGGNGLAAAWTEERTRALGAALRAFSGYYRSIVERGLRPFKVHQLETDPALGREDDLDDGFEALNLGPDGHFYPAISLLGFPSGRRARYRMGSLSAGVDWRRRDELRGDAERFLASGLGRGPSSVLLNNYFFARAAGLEPEPLLARAAAVLDVFDRGFKDLRRALRSGTPPEGASARRGKARGREAAGRASPPGDRGATPSRSSPAGTER